MYSMDYLRHAMGGASDLVDNVRLLHVVSIVKSNANGRM